VEETEGDAIVIPHNRINHDRIVALLRCFTEVHLQARRRYGRLGQKHASLALRDFDGCLIVFIHALPSSLENEEERVSFTFTDWRAWSAGETSKFVPQKRIQDHTGRIHRRCKFLEPVAVMRKRVIVAVLRRLDHIITLGP
jgi:hypothetical protein